MKNYCIVCNNELIEYNNFGNSCKSCNSVFTKEIPSIHELNDHYSSYNTEYHGGGRKTGAKNRQLLYALRYSKIVKKYANKKLLIDIGSANSPFPNLMVANGFNVTSVDFKKDINLDARVSFIASSLEQFSNFHSRFNVVTAFAVIEHLRNPILGINNLVNLCEKNGTLILLIPEIGSFSDRYAIGTSNWFCPPEHLNLLSKEAMCLLMSNLQCELVDYKKFEITIPRSVARYGIGIFEGILGYLLYNISKNTWIKIRSGRKSKYQGMALFVFKKK